MNAKDTWVILVADSIAEEGLLELATRPEFDVRFRPGMKGAELLAEMQEAHALLVRSATRVTEEVYASAPMLRAVGRAGSGVDNIDVDAATRRGVVVMNTPGGNSIAACEHTFALMLALFRNVAPAATELAAGTWNRKKYMGRQLHGKTLGLLGFGRIGREVGLRARAFGMEVLAADPFLTESVAREWDARLVDQERLLAEADVISLHLPSTPETHHIINAETLSRTKPGAVLINCARGDLVDDGALLDALNTGRLAGAAVDVFEQEPPSSFALVQHPNVVATPHLGASTEEAQLNVAVEIGRQVADYLARGEVRNAVNVPTLSAELYSQVRPFLDLAERLGSFAGQVADPQRTALEVRFRGDCMDLPRSPVVSAALVGLLRAAEGGSMFNYVNARLGAEELGLEVSEKALAESGDHTGLIELCLSGPSGSCTVAGVVTARGNPRLARWEGLGLDAPPSGAMLAIRNPDVPGVVGAIGTLLGQEGVNIAHIAWGRDESSREALTLINIDSPLSAATLERIREHPQVLWARAVEIG